MFHHLLVGTVEEQFCAGVLNDYYLCVRGQEDQGGATKEAVRVDARIQLAVFMLARLFPYSCTHSRGCR